MSPPTAPSSGTVLIVSPEPGASNPLVPSLAAAGYTVVTAQTEVEWLDRTRAGIDLVLLDGIPSGAQESRLLEGLARKASTARIPVLRVSGRPGASEEPGPGRPDLTLPRPVEPGRLVVAVATLVRLRRAEARLAELTLTLAESQAIRDRLRETEKMDALSRLAGGIAHHLNNLLAVSLGHGELMLQALPPGHALREDAEAVRWASASAARLIRQLLAFAYRQRLVPRLLDLNELLTRIGGTPTAADGATIRVVTRLQPVLPSVRADAEAIEQVVLNLAANGRQAMPDGGELTLESGVTTLAPGPRADGLGLPPGRYVTLAVRDTGLGMERRVRERAFEPLFSTRPPGQGTGLGLAVVYGIVRQHGGAVEVRSEPGRGSAFVVYLPAPADTTAPSRAVRGVDPAEPADGAGAATIGLGRLAVVRRGRGDLFHALKAELEGRAVARVIWDRREGDRRRAHHPVSAEARLAERRRPPSPAWEAVGFLVGQ